MQDIYDYLLHRNSLQADLSTFQTNIFEVTLQALSLLKSEDSQAALKKHLTISRFKYIKIEGSDMAS